VHFASNLRTVAGSQPDHSRITHSRTGRLLRETPGDQAGAI
jgi:hypothetical protein